MSKNTRSSRSRQAARTPRFSHDTASELANLASLNMSGTSSHQVGAGRDPRVVEEMLNFRPTASTVLAASPASAWTGPMLGEVTTQSPYADETIQNTNSLRTSSVPSISSRATSTIASSGVEPLNQYRSFQGDMTVQGRGAAESFCDRQIKREPDMPSKLHTWIARHRSSQPSSEGPIPLGAMALNNSFLNSNGGSLWSSCPQANAANPLLQPSAVVTSMAAACQTTSAAVHPERARMLLMTSGQRDDWEYEQQQYDQISVSRPKIPEGSNNIPLGDRSGREERSVPCSARPGVLGPVRTNGRIVKNKKAETKAAIPRPMPKGQGAPGGLTKGQRRERALQAAIAAARREEATKYAEKVIALESVQELAREGWEAVKEIMGQMREIMSHAAPAMTAVVKPSVDDISSFASPEGMVNRAASTAASVAADTFLAALDDERMREGTSDVPAVDAGVALAAWRRLRAEVRCSKTLRAGEEPLECMVLVVYR